MWELHEKIIVEKKHSKLAENAIWVLKSAQNEITLIRRSTNSNRRTRVIQIMADWKNKKSYLSSLTELIF